VNVIISFD